MTESLASISSKLNEDWQRVQRRWHETTQVWDDSIRRQFEREFWQPLEAQISATQREMERLANEISQAHHSIR